MHLEDRQREAYRDGLNNSPIYRHMGMRVIEAGDGRSRLELDACSKLHSLYGMLHGGVPATIIDSACGIAVGSTLNAGEICVTVDLRINYISNLKEGVICAEGKVLHRGKQTGVAQAEVKDEAGNLIAVGMSTHMILPPKDVRLLEGGRPGGEANPIPRL